VGASLVGLQGLQQEVKMAQIILDNDTARTLHEFTACVDLCDPSGRVLGRFIPLHDMSNWEAVSPDISDEDIERRLNSNERKYTSAEVLTFLDSL